MIEQRSEEGRDMPAAPERPEEGRGPEAREQADGFRSYSLEVLLLLED